MNKFRKRYTQSTGSLLHALSFAWREKKPAVLVRITAKIRTSDQMYRGGSSGHGYGRRSPPEGVPRGGRGKQGASSQRSKNRCCGLRIRGLLRFPR
ncbi:hypothetical protein CEXT_666311 [Caerostris extrusa]|uniref:Ribosomal protein L15 n=1 Tax=Caerostris extrusa TaxID=172846 RepID=A0AAV4WAX1_CAEEX|nr:hypothetical protein CEXT_666311 [Caerostris extrusa]